LKDGGTQPRFFSLQNLPPVRNQAKKKKKKKQEPSVDIKKDNQPKERTRISSYDYRSWDKFDVVSFLKTNLQSFSFKQVVLSTSKGSAPKGKRLF